jgi:hypothetical protein
VQFLINHEDHLSYAASGLHNFCSVSRLRPRLIPCLVIELALAWDEKTAFSAVFSCAKDLSLTWHAIEVLRHGS